MASNSLESLRTETYNSKPIKSYSECYIKEKINFNENVKKKNRKQDVDLVDNILPILKCSSLPSLIKVNLNKSLNNNSTNYEMYEFNNENGKEKIDLKDDCFSIFKIQSFNSINPMKILNNNQEILSVNNDVGIKNSKNVDNKSIKTCTNEIFLGKSNKSEQEKYYELNEAPESKIFETRPAAGANLPKIFIKTNILKKNVNFTENTKEIPTFNKEKIPKLPKNKKESADSAPENKKLTESHEIVKKSHKKTRQLKKSKKGKVCAKVVNFFGHIFSSKKEPVEKMSWDKYHTMTTIKHFLYQMAEKYPRLVRIKCIGRTCENRPILIIKISENFAHRDIIVIEAGIHAREWISPATATYVINKLLTGWACLPDYLKNKTWIFIPVMNPDGYDYSWKTNRMWRKNCRKICKTDCVGVDLNRNFNCAWNQNPHNDPCHLNYRGPKPFSERESRAVRDFLLPIRKHLKGYISLHSFGQDVRFYWNLDEEIEDVERVLEIAEMGVKKMCKVDKVTYRVRPTPKKFIFGSSRDWVRKVLDVKYAYVIELRDRGQYGFLLPDTQIIPNGKEVFEFLKIVAWAIDDDIERNKITESKRVFRRICKKQKI